MVVDGQAKKAYDAVALAFFSSDSRHVAFTAQRGGKWFIVMDGREEAAYNTVSMPLFSPDGKHVSYLAQKEGIWLVVTDGKEGPAYAEVANLSWSPDSRHLVYMAERSGFWLVCVDGRPAQNVFQGFIEGSSLQFITPDRLRTLAVKTGKAGPEFITYEIEIRK